MFCEALYYLRFLGNDKVASTGSATGLRQAQPPGFVNFVRRPSVCAQSPGKVMEVMEVMEVMKNPFP